MLKEIKIIINLLKGKKMNISVAESCTGGMLAEVLTSTSGASKIFKFGIITYSNQSKIKYLKVPSKLIKKYGSVSKQCCNSMVNNLSKLSKTNVSLAITGIAGPGGGSRLKPVGLVYVGIKRGSKIKIEKYLFKNKNRRNIRVNSVKKSLQLIKSFI